MSRAMSMCHLSPHKPRTQQTWPFSLSKAMTRPGWRHVASLHINDAHNKPDYSPCLKRWPDQGERYVASLHINDTHNKHSTPDHFPCLKRWPERGEGMWPSPHKKHTQHTWPLFLSKVMTRARWRACGLSPHKQHAHSTPDHSSCPRWWP